MESCDDGQSNFISEGEIIAVLKMKLFFSNNYSNIVKAIRKLNLLFIIKNFTGDCSVKITLAQARPVMLYISLVSLYMTGQDGTDRHD